MDYIAYYKAAAKFNAYVARMRAMSEEISRGWWDQLEYDVLGSQRCYGPPGTGPSTPLSVIGNCGYKSMATAEGGGEIVSGVIEEKKGGRKKKRQRNSR